MTNNEIILLAGLILLGLICMIFNILGGTFYLFSSILEWMNTEKDSEDEPPAKLELFIQLVVDETKLYKNVIQVDEMIDMLSEEHNFYLTEPEREYCKSRYVKTL